MAGSWDGDAIAEQLEDAAERRIEAQEKSHLDNSTPDERLARTRVESLRMSHARTVEQLGRASNPAHREMLERALRALEAEMGK